MKKPLEFLLNAMRMCLLSFLFLRLLYPSFPQKPLARAVQNQYYPSK